MTWMSSTNTVLLRWPCLTVSVKYQFDIHPSVCLFQRAYTRDSPKGITNTASDFSAQVLILFLLLLQLQRIYITNNHIQAATGPCRFDFDTLLSSYHYSSTITVPFLSPFMATIYKVTNPSYFTFSLFFCPPFFPPSPPPSSFPFSCTVIYP